MSEKLRFDADDYVNKVIVFRGEEIPYRQYTVSYVERPEAPDIQRMNILVREDMAGDHTAPVMFVHRDGGVGESMPWSQEMEYEEQHTVWSFKGHTMVGAFNAPKEPESVIGRILKEGFVLASPGVRGRDSIVGGVYVGRDVRPSKANGEKRGIPATILDLKAAVRYLRYNKGLVPGDVEKIISEGASSGGGSSALLGASGNSPLFEDYLKDMGAAEAKDNIYCAIVDSPIHDFEHIDIAYEWQFGPEYVKGLFDDNAQAMNISLAAKDKYTDYIDSLQLKDPESGEILSVRDGSYQNYMLRKLNESLNTYLEGMSLDEKAAWLSDEKNAGLARLEGDHAVINSFASYIGWNAGRWMKYVGCYDGSDANPSRENEAFGSRDGRTGHFSVSLAECVNEVVFSTECENKDNSPKSELTQGNMLTQENAQAWLAEAKQNAEAVNLLDSYKYIRGESMSDLAPVWYLRDGGHHETTGTIFLNMCLLLEERTDIKLDWRFCWQQNHTSISLKEFDETLPFLKALVV